MPGWNEIEVAVVGSGAMGSLLAQAYAQNGVVTGLVGRSEQSLEWAQGIISRELGDAVAKGIFSPPRAEEIKGLIVATEDPEKAFQSESLWLVIESAAEDFEVKKNILQKADHLCAPQVVLATNTSSLDADKLAGVTARPDRVVWMHYFFPPHKNRGGEYAGTQPASPESRSVAAEYMEKAGKKASSLLKYRKGGAANVLFVALLLEAARQVDEGFDVPSIETAGKKAFDLPVGFLSLMDMVGFNLALSCLRSFSDSSDPGDPLHKAYDNFFSPPAVLEKKIEEFRRHQGKTRSLWVTEADRTKEPGDWLLVGLLERRFLGVAFMTAAELVEAGIITMDELDRLCQNAFQWKEGPFSIMNRVGTAEALRIVTEKMELSHRKEINFPVPRLLIEQAQKGEPWPLAGGMVS